MEDPRGAVARAVAVELDRVSAAPELLAHPADREGTVGECHVDIDIGAELVAVRE